MLSMNGWKRRGTKREDPRRFGERLEARLVICKKAAMNAKGWWRTSTKHNRRSRFQRSTPGTVAQEAHLVDTYLVKMECYFKTFKSEDEEGVIQLRTCILMGLCK